MLVSSPGFGVLDSGCGRTIIGAKTLDQYEKLLAERGIVAPVRMPEVNSFRFGNGATEMTAEVVLLPCRIAGKKGTISAAVVKGAAPLLISRTALQALHACLDFQKSEITLFAEQIRVPLNTNAAGQYVLNLLDDDFSTARDSSDQANIDVPIPTEEISADPQPEEQPEVLSTSTSPPEPSFRWMREDWGATHVPIASGNGPKWDKITRRIVRRGDNGKVMWDEHIDVRKPRTSYHHQIPKGVCHVVTEFQHVDPHVPDISRECLFSKHQCRSCPSSCNKLMQLRGPNRED